MAALAYDLAKELDEAGFPQAGKGEWVGSSDHLVLRGADRVYVPTLSELIEACGPLFATLSRDENWKASNGLGMSESGESPEEAVARLWLALNQTHDRAEEST
jgi:hypothetical protein